MEDKDKDKDKDRGYLEKDKENKASDRDQGWDKDKGPTKDSDKKDKDKDKEVPIVLPPASFLTAGHVSCEQLRDALSSAGLVFSPHEVNDGHTHTPTYIHACIHIHAYMHDTYIHAYTLSCHTDPFILPPTLSHFPPHSPTPH